VKPRVTEAEFLAQVLAYARLHGWRAVHFRAARVGTGWRTAVQGDGAGFPRINEKKTGQTPRKKTCGRVRWVSSRIE